MFKVNNSHQNNVIDCVMSSCPERCLVPVLIINFTPCSIVSIADFEQEYVRLGKIFMAQRFNQKALPSLVHFQEFKPCI